MAADNNTYVEELWKPVYGFSRAYEVSNYGRLRSGKRILRPYRATPKGYLSIKLRKGGGRCSVHIHKLVLEAFVGPRPVGMECCHGNSDPLDNRLANLRWDTHRANMRDQKDAGNAASGERHGAAKLTEAQVLEIRRRRGLGEPCADLAACYGVSRCHVSRIARGVKWTHLA